jgi:hypothetical protein
LLKMVSVREEHHSPGHHKEQQDVHPGIPALHPVRNQIQTICNGRALRFLIQGVVRHHQGCKELENSCYGRAQELF